MLWGACHWAPQNTREPYLPQVKAHACTETHTHTHQWRPHLEPARHHHHRRRPHPPHRPPPCPAFPRPPPAAGPPAAAAPPARAARAAAPPPPTAPPSPPPLRCAQTACQSRARWPVGKWRDAIMKEFPYFFKDGIPIPYRDAVIRCGQAAKHTRQASAGNSRQPHPQPHTSTPPPHLPPRPPPRTHTHTHTQPHARTCCRSSSSPAVAARPSVRLASRFSLRSLRRSERLFLSPALPSTASASARSSSSCW